MDAIPGERRVEKEDPRHDESVQVRRHHVARVFIRLKGLVTHQNIITFDDSQYEISAEDVNALLNLLNSKCRMPDADYWMPICFSSISDEGFLHLYYRNISPGLGIMLVSTDSENIGEAVQMCQKIEIVLMSHARVSSKKR